MEPEIGSVLQIMPAEPGWSAMFVDDTEGDKAIPWEEAIIAWAVVVIWTNENEDPKPERLKYQTEVQPFTVNQDGHPEVPAMRDDVSVLAVLQPGQLRVPRDVS